MIEGKYQRYTYTHPYDNAYEIVDRKIDMAMKPEDVTELLNKQAERIEELEDKDWYEQCIEQLEEQNARLLQENEQLKQKVKENRQHAEFWQSAYKRCIDREEKSQKQLAIEKLEKVKELIHNYVRKRNKECEVGYYDEIPRYIFDEIIDNQIKKLGGENKCE